MMMIVAAARAHIDQLGDNLADDPHNSVGVEITSLQVISFSCHHIYSAYHPQPKMRRV